MLRNFATGKSRTALDANTRSFMAGFTQTSNGRKIDVQNTDSTPTDVHDSEGALPAMETKRLRQ